MANVKVEDVDQKYLKRQIGEHDGCEGTRKKMSLLTPDGGCAASFRTDKTGLPRIEPSGINVSFPYVEDEMEVDASESRGNKGVDTSDDQQTGQSGESQDRIIPVHSFPKDGIPSVLSHPLLAGPLEQVTAIIDKNPQLMTAIHQQISRRLQQQQAVELQRQMAHQAVQRQQQNKRTPMSSESPEMTSPSQSGIVRNSSHHPLSPDHRQLQIQNQQALAQQVTAQRMAAQQMAQREAQMQALAQQQLVIRTHARAQPQVLTQLQAFEQHQLSKRRLFTCSQGPQTLSQQSNHPDVAPSTIDTRLGEKEEHDILEQFDFDSFLGDELPLGGSMTIHEASPLDSIESFGSKSFQDPANLQWNGESGPQVSEQNRVGIPTPLSTIPQTHEPHPMGCLPRACQYPQLSLKPPPRWASTEEQQRFRDKLFSKENLERVFGYGPGSAADTALPEGYTSVGEFRDSLTMLAHGNKFLDQIYENQQSDTGRKTNELGLDWPGTPKGSGGPKVHAGDCVVHDYQMQQILQVLKNKCRLLKARMEARDFLPQDDYSGTYTLEGFFSKQTRYRLVIARRENGTVDPLLYSYVLVEGDPTWHDEAMLLTIRILEKQKQDTKLRLARGASGENGAMADGSGDYIMEHYRLSVTLLERQNKKRRLRGAEMSGVGNMHLQNYEMQIMLLEQQNKTRVLEARQGSGGGDTTISHALQDYLMQLKLLEQQSKKGRLEARQVSGENDTKVAGSGNKALQDYQMQLMLLEQQNKKRDLMARQPIDSEVTKMAGSGTEPLQDCQMQLMLLEQQNKKRLLMARQPIDSEVTKMAGSGTEPLQDFQAQRVLLNERGLPERNGADDKHHCLQGYQAGSLRQEQQNRTQLWGPQRTASALDLQQLIILEQQNKILIWEAKQKAGEGDPEKLQTAKQELKIHEGQLISLEQGERWRVLEAEYAAGDIDTPEFATRLQLLEQENKNIYLKRHLEGNKVDAQTQESGLPLPMQPEQKDPMDAGSKAPETAAALPSPEDLQLHLSIQNERHELSTLRALPSPCPELFREVPFTLKLYESRLAIRAQGRLAMDQQLALLCLEQQEKKRLLRKRAHESRKDKPDEGALEEIKWGLEAMKESNTARFRPSWEESQRMLWEEGDGVPLVTEWVMGDGRGMEDGEWSEWAYWLKRGVARQQRERPRGADGGVAHWDEMLREAMRRGTPPRAAGKRGMEKSQMELEDEEWWALMQPEEEEWARTAAMSDGPGREKGRGSYEVKGPAEDGMHVPAEPARTADEPAAGGAAARPDDEDADEMDTQGGMSPWDEVDDWDASPV